jgi:translation initiation factor 1 (eIF-1/SUI1)
MSIEEFKDELMEDEDILAKVPILKNNIKKGDTISRLYFLCRQTYLTQHSAEIFKNDEGYGCFISDEKFKLLGNHINDYLNLFEEVGNKELLDEILIILKGYYNKTATSEEIKSRMHHESPNDNAQRYGFRGTLYNFNEIDWDYFADRLKANMM